MHVEIITIVCVYIIYFFQLLIENLGRIGSELTKNLYETKTENTEE